MTLSDEWAPVVGAQIAAVTAARMVTRDGTLFVDVATDAWLQELSRMEPRLLRALRQRSAGISVQRIRWRLASVADRLEPLLELVREDHAPGLAEDTQA